MWWNESKTNSVFLFLFLMGLVTAAKEIKELWEEYENNSSPEAKLVKDFNKVSIVFVQLEFNLFLYIRTRDDFQF